MKNDLIIKDDDVFIQTANEYKPIGKILGESFHKKETLDGLLNKYCAWTVYKEILSSVKKVVITTGDFENPIGEEFTFVYTVNHKDKLESIEDGTNIPKVAIPLKYFEITPSNDFDNKFINAFGNEWFFKLKEELGKSYMKELSNTLKKERATYKIYPSAPNVFRALKLTQYNDVKVVIIGQDPYHNGLADGLAFSSLNELITPKSLQNIFTEIENDIYNGLMLDRDPRLDRWSKQGVLLLNTVLTVRDGQANSHHDIGWERFTSEIIRSLYKYNKPIVWLLWGQQAKNTFYSAIAVFDSTNSNQLVLTAAHPSPFSVNGFYGCKHFSKCNKFLTSKGQNGIDW